MSWRDFFFLSWFVSDEENERLRQENEALRQEIERRRWEEERDRRDWEDSCEGIEKDQD